MEGSETNFSEDVLTRQNTRQLKRHVSQQAKEGGLFLASEEWRGRHEKW
jgi:hypothetical protein